MIKTLAILLSLVSLNAFACDIHGKDGYMPKNDMYISADDKNANNMTEEIFNTVIDKAITHYEPIIAALGKRLQVIRKWEDGTVNAYAQQQGKTWKVSMFGGLARHADVTADGFALVLCHELGHHLAGAPKVVRYYRTTWASNEGQSDYWATAKCFRRIYQSEDNDTIVNNMEIDPEVTKQCNAAWTSNDEIKLCERMSQAAKGLAKLLNRGKDVSFTTPDMTVVRKTNHAHPKGQCRLDTYFNGSLCDKAFDEDTSMTNDKVGVCNRTESYTKGVRPLCWFKPSNK
jgi:hypothetical protein